MLAFYYTYNLRRTIRSSSTSAIRSFTLELCVLCAWSTAGHNVRARAMVCSTYYLVAGSLFTNNTFGILDEISWRRCTLRKGEQEKNMVWINKMNFIRVSIISASFVLLNVWLQHTSCSFRCRTYALCFSNAMSCALNFMHHMPCWLLTKQCTVLCELREQCAVCAPTVYMIFIVLVYFLHTNEFPMGHSWLQYNKSTSSVVRHTRSDIFLGLCGHRKTRGGTNEAILNEIDMNCDIQHLYGPKNMFNTSDHCFSSKKQQIIITDS